MIDVLVIGGGPGGLAAAVSASKAGASVMLLDREHALGGILKQCIHDGFGLQRFHKQLSGPSYAQAFIDEILLLPVDIRLDCFVFEVSCLEDGSFRVLASSRDGIIDVNALAVVSATGCRERTARQVSIHGDRVSGVFNAGCIQNLVNLHGYMPGQRCAILGSGDIGLIMARRLTLEGAEVVGVFEAKKTPSGLERNIHQCLDDFGIPLHLGCTVTRTIGHRRLEAVEVADTDDAMNPILSTSRIVSVDSLIVSVGLIPEVELLKNLPVKMDSRTHGPVIDQKGMTSVPGLFCCGNSSLVYDLVDYVSLASETAGQSAAKWAKNRGLARKTEIQVHPSGSLLFISPSLIDMDSSSVRFFFRASEELEGRTLTLCQNGHEIFKRTYSVLRPPQMETFEIRTELLDPDHAVEASL